MSDRDDDLLTGAFGAYQQDAMPHIRPAGTAAVRAIVRRRRRVRVATLAAVVAVLTIAPVMGSAILQRSPVDPPVVGTTADPSPTASPSPLVPPRLPQSQAAAEWVATVAGDSAPVLEGTAPMDAPYRTSHQAALDAPVYRLWVACAGAGLIEITWKIGDESTARQHYCWSEDLPGGDPAAATLGVGVLSLPAPPGATAMEVELVPDREARDHAGAAFRITAAEAPGPITPITAAELGETTIDVPAWPVGEDWCPDGRQTFGAGAAPAAAGTSAITATILQVEALAPSGDQTAAAVALLACRVGQAVDKQVVAFRRDAAGQIVTLGPVVQLDSEFTYGPPLNLRDILGVATEGELVRVEVANLQPCCGTPQQQVVRQWRGYQFDGSRFVQVDGPTSFLADIDAADVTATDLVLSPTASGELIGSLTITVTNRIGQDLGPLSVYVEGSFPSGLATLSGTGCTADDDRYGPDATAICELGSLAGGDSASVTLTVTVPEGGSDSDGWVGVVHLRIGPQIHPTPYRFTISTE